MLFRSTGAVPLTFKVLRRGVWLVRFPKYGFLAHLTITENVEFGRESEALKPSQVRMGRTCRYSRGQTRHH